MFKQNSLSLNKYFERRNPQTPFCCLCVNLPTVKIRGHSGKFPRSFSFLQCLLQVIIVDLEVYCNLTQKDQIACLPIWKGYRGSWAGSFSTSKFIGRNILKKVQRNQCLNGHQLKKVHKNWPNFISCEVYMK